LFSANTLGQSVFSRGAPEMNFNLERGENAQFKYRLVIASEDLSDEAINLLADDYGSDLE
jgi:hypothetical protein